MSTKKKPVLAVFWGDTRTLLTKKERSDLLHDAVLESITPSEVLLRDRKTLRLIVVTSVSENELFCALCVSDAVRERYGHSCPSFAKCIVRGQHEGQKIKVK